MPTSVVHLNCEKTSVILSAVISLHDAQEDPLQAKSKITVNSQLKLVISTYSLQHVFGKLGHFQVVQKIYKILGSLILTLGFIKKNRCHFYIMGKSS